jgi:hypothetical protein
VPWSYKEYNWGYQVSSVRESVKRGLEDVKLRISTAGEEAAGWKRASGFCGD